MQLTEAIDRLARLPAWDRFVGLNARSRRLEVSVITVELFSLFEGEDCMAPCRMEYAGLRRYGAGDEGRENVRCSTRIFAARSSCSCARSMSVVKLMRATELRVCETLRRLGLALLVTLPLPRLLRGVPASRERLRPRVATPRRSASKLFCRICIDEWFVSSIMSLSKR